MFETLTDTRTACLERWQETAHAADLIYPDRCVVWAALPSAEDVAGDHDLFARMVRADLAGHDIAANLIYCIREDGRAHLVAEADGWIIDARLPGILKAHRVPYTWIAAFEGDGWRDLRGA